MIKASYNDKAIVVDILSESFDTNGSVNFVIRQDKSRKGRIRRLMEYSFDLCYLFGDIYLSGDKKACALTLFPDRKKTTLKTILLDVKLAFSCIGLSRILKVLERESAIKSNYPSTPILHLWFIGVAPSMQGKGLGKQLLSEIINESKNQNRPIYLETSMTENLSFYEKAGFEIYKQLEQPHKLFLIRRNLN